MGNPHSRPEDRLRYISREVNSLRANLQTSRQNISRHKKEFIVESLAHYSNEVKLMTGKVKRKNVEESLKNISETMEEVLKIEPSELDAAAVESDSFVNVPLSQRRSNSLGSLRSSKKAASQTSVNRSSVPTLRNIEAKLSELKTQISTAIDNRDTKQLRVYQQTIRVLATDLELVRTEKDTPLEKRKDGIDKKIVLLYQKVSRTLNELKKDDNLRSPSKQQRKDKAMNELAEIEIRLAENESLLDKLIKEKNSSDFAAIRNNIVENNQNLAKVDIVDNDIKEKVVLISQKLTETVKNLDRIMAKREFDSKFAKALEAYERIVKNFDGNTNAEDVKNNLQSIRNSVQNLEDINDTSKNRKKVLLNNINSQMENVYKAIEKESDKKIIEKIVEDNVILRKKVKSTDKEHTVIDQFINYWNNVKSNFNVNSYSNLSLLRIDSILEEMQQSINDIRIGIANKCDTKPPSNLTKKISQSVPKLNTRQNYGSNRSLDQLDSKVIKTRAKMYNISTPELQNVEKQQQDYTKNRFSKIEEIKAQVYYIREKINESHNKNLLREKLEEYLMNLGNYISDSNKTVANNAVWVSNEITELLHRLVLAELKENVYVLSKRVHNFNGTRYDNEFDEMKEGLIKVQLNLKNLNIPNQYESLQHERDELLDEVNNSMESLQEKSSYYRKHQDEHVKQIKAKLQVLSEKVKRFSGTYKGVMYNNIERDLNKLLLDVGEQVEDKAWTDEITKETERLLKILEQRSSLAQSFRSTKLEETKTEKEVGMAKIKRDLYNIKREIDRTPENNVDAFIGLQSRLDLVTFELSQIPARSNENLSKEKEIFSNEAQTLRNVVDAKVALGQQPAVQWPDRELQPDLTTYPKNDVNKEIEQFENSFAIIKDEVTAPNNAQDVHKFYKLAQDIKNLMDKLTKYRFIRGTDLHTRQTSLKNEMQYYVDALEKGATDVDYVLSMERKLDKLENLFGSGQLQDLTTMAKELQGIQNKLQEHNFNTSNENLRSRKTSVQQKTDDLVQKLKALEDKGKKQRLQETKEFEEIERKVQALAPQISSFVGLKSEKKYYELNEATIKLILNLDKFAMENDQLQRQRIKLLKDLHTLGQVLDERAEQTEEIVRLEQELDEVSSMLNNFSDEEDDLNSVKLKMENIRSKLNGLKVTSDLIARKNSCIERFSVLFNKAMTLTAGPPQQIKSTHYFQPDHSSGYSSQTSTNHTEITGQVSTGYSTRIYNFVTKDSNINSDVSQENRTATDNVLSQIDNEIEGIESAVNATNDSDQLQTFDDALTQFTIKIGKLNYTKTSPQYPKVFQLYQRIENLTDVIELKLEENDRLNAISQEVDDISSQMDTHLTYEQINHLDERLIQLQVTLGKMTNTSLKTQIDGCMLRIILCLQKISEYRASIIQGTPV